MTKQPAKNKTKPLTKSTQPKEKVMRKSSNPKGELLPIFKAIQLELKKYEPPFASRQNSDDAYDLWSDKEVIFAGKVRKEVYFASVVRQKKYIGFYYMPIYIEPELKSKFKPELLKKLKGKSCFHIQKLDDDLLPQIKEALRIGLDLYKKKGWL